MKRIETSLPGVCLIEPSVFEDERGFCFDSYHEIKFAELGIRDRFVQDNHARSSNTSCEGCTIKSSILRPSCAAWFRARCLMWWLTSDTARPIFSKWESRGPHAARRITFELSSFAGYMLGALAVAAISGVDDLFGVSAPARLLVHLFAAAIFVAFAGFVSRIYLPFLGEVDWGLGVPITRSSIGGGRCSGCLAFSFR
jgi:hypothetical protein